MKNETKVPLSTKKLRADYFKELEKLQEADTEKREDSKTIKRYHITYFLPDTDVPTLSGVTVGALNIIDATVQAINKGITLNTIKYILEL